LFQYLTKLSYQPEEIYILAQYIDNVKNTHSAEFTHLKTSSGNSIIVLFDKFICKIYNKSYRNEVKEEVNILEELKECNHVVKLINFNTEFPIIFYEKLVPLTSIELNGFAISQTKKLVSNIAKALFEIHSKNYVHRDTGHTNICKRGNEYVFIDFETAVRSDKYGFENFQEYMFNDVNQFLEDIKLHINDRESIQYINNVLNILKINCITTEKREIMFLGKKRSRDILKINYNIKYFLDIIKSI
jgi:tRNA A-37 threonylcarbamoyl transferase component Bud32